MTDGDIMRIKERYARQTARWNQIRARFAALPVELTLRVPTQLLEDLGAIGTVARRIGPLPRSGVKA